MSEFAELNLTGAVLVDFLDELLDIDGHLELFFDCFYEFFGIDAPSTVCLASHGHVGVEQLVNIGASDPLEFAVHYHSFEVAERNGTNVVGVNLADHLEHLTLSKLNSDHF